MPETPDWYAAMEPRLGARWVKCAFQVNPFSYVTRHGVEGHEFADEESYNQALIEALLAEGVELIAIADHFRIRHSEGLAAAAREVGIHVLPGFEAATSEGVHVLVLFSSETASEVVQARISQCGIVSDTEPSPLGDKGVVDLLAAAKSWGAVCIAAHATYDNGLLKHLEGGPRVRAWCSKDLEAVSIAKTVDSLPSPYREILRNDDREHRRERLPAIVNAADVSGPGDARRDGATCFLKLSELSLSAVRQAFLEPHLRIRVLDTPEPRQRPVVRAIHWEGGLLDGQTLQFADELTVLVGAPGSGKSTLIESIRAAFGQRPTSDRAREDHDGILAEVLGQGTSISVVVDHPEPLSARYVVQRVLPAPPAVLRADDWQASGLDVSDLEQVQIFGQHEVADLAADPGRRRALIERFAPDQIESDKKIASLEDELEQNRRLLASQADRVADMEAQVSLLPSKQEQLSAYEKAGVAEKLELDTLFDREHRAIQVGLDRLRAFGNAVRELPASTLQSVVSSNNDLDGSEFREELLKVDSALASVATAVTSAQQAVDTAINEGVEQIERVRAAWKERRTAADGELQAIKEQLKVDDINPETFRELRRTVDELEGLTPTLEEAREGVAELRRQRAEFFAQLDAAIGKRYRDLEKAARRVTGQLPGVVEVRVHQDQDLDALDALLRNASAGRIKETIELLDADAAYSARELAARIREGAPALVTRWKLSASQADRLTKLDDTIIQSIEELSPRLLTDVRLNIGTKDHPRWKQLERLSKGQKATAILLLLLLDSRAPLIVDQPEDDLDNAFIADHVVPKIRDEKAARQFVFATHNANVPVLADAELIVGLEATEDDDGQLRAEAPESQQGSLDATTIRTLVEQRLEGGHDAFEERARKYNA